MDWNKRIGSKIRKYRKRANINQEALGKRVGLSRTTIANIELGKHSFTSKHFHLFSKALDINPVFLFFDTEELKEAGINAHLIKENNRLSQRLRDAEAIFSSVQKYLSEYSPIHIDLTEDTLERQGFCESIIQ